MDFGAICVSTTVADASSPSPFQETMMLVTLGFIIALILSSPFFFYDLDQSILLTVASAFVALVVMFVWIGLSTDAGLILDRVPLSSPFSITYVQTMGTIMLNLGCATVVPSWINIKSNLVRTQSVMWTTLVASTAFYLIIGIFFALGFPSNDSNNSLQALIQLGSPTWLCKASVAVYAYMMLLPSVPVNFIVSFQNLTQNKVMGRKSAYVVAFIVPILVCIPLQTRNYLFLFLTWSSLIFNSSVNFILPLVIYIKSVAFRRSFHDRGNNMNLRSFNSASTEITGNYSFKINGNRTIFKKPACS